MVSLSLGVFLGPQNYFWSQPMGTDPLVQCISIVFYSYDWSWSWTQSLVLTRAAVVLFFQKLGFWMVVWYGGGNHGHGGTPARWLISKGKSHRSKWMITRGTPSCGHPQKVRFFFPKSKGMGMGPHPLLLAPASQPFRSAPSESQSAFELLSDKIMALCAPAQELLVGRLGPVAANRIKAITRP